MPRLFCDDDGHTIDLEHVAMIGERGPWPDEHEDRVTTVGDVEIEDCVTVLIQGQFVRLRMSEDTRRWAVAAWSTEPAA